MTQTLPNRELVTYVLSLLGGESKRLHTEDVAVKCYELFPESFSWTKYPQYPDKDIVRVALTDARKLQYGALVAGRSGQTRGHSAATKRGPMSDGWALTEAGARWVGENKARLESLAGGTDLKAHRQTLLKDLARVRKHRLFLLYVERPNSFVPSLGEIADLFRCRVDAPEAVWNGRFEGVQHKAVTAGQTDVADFVSKCRVAYVRLR